MGVVILIKKYFMAIVLLSLCLTLFSCSLNDEGDTEKNLGTESVVTTTASSEKQEEKNKSDSEDELYDSTAVSEAYMKGSDSGLDDLQKAIYEKASQIISENISDSMTDYEKELAIHDYLISHCTYDDSHLLVFERHGKNAVDPYGTLIEGKAICSGYTSTFQMFMDMLKIPCKSIKATDKSGQDHAWNMVELGGEWYYVDVTWDDPIPDCDGRLISHSYFNVTEEFMKQEHKWKNDEYPKADSIEYSYGNQSIKNVDDISKVEKLLENAVDKMSDTLYIEFDKKLNIDISKLNKTSDGDDVEKAVPGLNNVVEKFQDKNDCLVVYYPEKIGTKSIMEFEIMKIDETTK